MNVGMHDTSQDAARAWCLPTTFPPILAADLLQPHLPPPFTSPGGKTCYKHVFSTTLEQAQSRDKAALPAEFAEARFCEEYETRCDSAARTWLRPHALDNLLGIVPLGQVKSNFQYSVVDKRVLNFENVVDDDDNIKQDLSIDVYGRKAADEAAAALAADGASPVAGGAAEVAEEEEDDIDALLA